MHADMEGKRIPLAQQSKGAQRRRRLARGLARWDAERKELATPWRSLAVVVLTLPPEPPEKSQGRIYKFLAKMRRQWLGTRYFCWLELQRNGTVHYNVIWLDPPRVPHKQMYAWVHHAWGAGRTQYRVKYARDALGRALEYAEKYTRKMRWKAYQQAYDQVPRTLRTYMNQRLQAPLKDVDDTIEKDLWAYHDAGWFAGSWRAAYLEYAGHFNHYIPPGGRCRLHHVRRQPYRRRSRPAARAPGAGGPQSIRSTSDGSS
jgi:hypothetical protein